MRGVPNMRYMIFVIDSQSRSATGDDMVKIDQFNQMLMDKNHWITAGGLCGPEGATLVDNRDKLEVQAGSLFRSPEFYSGFWLLEAESEAQALELAKLGSKACNRRVELRPFL